MNTQLNTNNSFKSQLTVVKKLIFSVLLAASSSVYAADSYQLKVLFAPSESNLEAGANGRVMIYDSLKSETVDLAMNEQEGGDYVPEDDGCD